MHFVSWSVSLGFLLPLLHFLVLLVLNVLEGLSSSSRDRFPRGLGGFKEGVRQTHILVVEGEDEVVGRHYFKPKAVAVEHR